VTAASRHGSGLPHGGRTTLRSDAVEQGRRPYYSKDVAKVTSKLQVTVPKAIAQRFGIEPGDEIEWEAAGDAIRIVPARPRSRGGTIPARLKLFDQATARQRERGRRIRRAEASQRGWTREELYGRGGSR
jgi:AbrB family looped-hinge helix DNA binding protein